MYRTLVSYDYLEFSKSVEPSSRKTRATKGSSEKKYRQYVAKYQQKNNFRFHLPTRLIQQNLKLNKATEKFMSLVHLKYDLKIFSIFKMRQNC